MTSPSEGGPAPLLAELTTGLDSAVAEVYEAAGQAMPGGSPGWDALLLRWYLRPPPSADRAARATRTGQVHYALAVEFRALLHVVSSAHDHRLEEIKRAQPDAFSPGTDAWSTAAGLRSRLLNLVDHQGAAYEAQALPEKPKSQLGGIFANAQRKVRPEPGAGWETAVVLHCVSCGAPQSSARVFVCCRCDQPIFGHQPRE